MTFREMSDYPTSLRHPSCRGAWEFPLGKAAQHAYAEIVTEVNKCSCICAVHHREIHGKKRELPPDARRLVVRPDMLPPTAPHAVVELA